MFETRNKIINALEDGTFPLAKDMQEKQTKEANFKWLHRTKDELESVIKYIRSESDLNVIIDTKKITLNNTEDFLKDILTGKINKRNDAKKEYLKKTQDDVDLLKSSSLW